MFKVLSSFQTANNVLHLRIKKMRSQGYTVLFHKHKLNDKYMIHKITIKSNKRAKNRLVLSSGLHGVEGYVGHAAIHTFLDNFLERLNPFTEIIIYPALNPYGMDQYQRTNENNVDLNRNFSKNNFSSENNNYLSVKDFVEPKVFRNRMTMNSSFYFDISNLIRKHGISYLNEAFLLGQNVHDKGIYYTGTSYEPETQYVMNEFTTYMKSKLPLVWIDIHSGYGPKKQMSIINSKYEIDTTLKMIDQYDYPLILGANEDDIYDTDGDIIEKLYSINKDYPKTQFYGTCFEFGTVGEGSLKSIESLKAITTMNHIRFEKRNKRMNDYAKKLMKKQFAPKDEKWCTKAHDDFIAAMNMILEYKKLA